MPDPPASMIPLRIDSPGGSAQNLGLNFHHCNFLLHRGVSLHDEKRVNRASLLSWNQNSSGRLFKRPRRRELFPPRMMCPAAPGCPLHFQTNIPADRQSRPCEAMLVDPITKCVSNIAQTRQPPSIAHRLPVRFRTLFATGLGMATLTAGMIPENPPFSSHPHLISPTVRRNARTTERHRKSSCTLRNGFSRDALRRGARL